MKIEPQETRRVWGDYVNWDDVARFEYGRRMWRMPEMRARLLAHWTDDRHPYRERFAAHRAMVERALSSDADPVRLDEELRKYATSLRCVAREIPPVFGSFFS
ncbi:MAG: hypothetical protein FJ404_02495 [Verrucomicrobia bacterium]|nr:hypothetical protein [Verrucomicrobiota bacterium]